MLVFSQECGEFTNHANAALANLPGIIIHHRPHLKKNQPRRLRHSLPPWQHSHPRPPWECQSCYQHLLPDSRDAPEKKKRWQVLQWTRTHKKKKTKLNNHSQVYYTENHKGFFWKVKGATYPLMQHAAMDGLVEPPQPSPLADKGCFLEKFHLFVWPTPEKFNIDFPKWPDLKGSHLLQTIILGIYASFREVCQIEAF